MAVGAVAGSVIEGSDDHTFTAGVTTLKDNDGLVRFKKLHHLCRRCDWLVLGDSGTAAAAFFYYVNTLIQQMRKYKHVCAYRNPRSDTVEFGLSGPYYITLGFGSFMDAILGLSLIHI